MDFAALLPWLGWVGSTAVGVGGIVITWRKLVVDSRNGVATSERELKRDTVADRDAFIDQLQERVERVETRLTDVEEELYVERQWNLMLVDHIYRQLPPPPPKRPERR